MEKTGDKRSRWKMLLEFLRRHFGRKPPSSPADRYAYVWLP